MVNINHLVTRQVNAGFTAKPTSTRIYLNTIEKISIQGTWPSFIPWPHTEQWCSSYQGNSGTCTSNQVDSTNAMYRSDLQTFQSWCQSPVLQGHNPVISDIANFIIFLPSGQEISTSHYPEIQSSSTRSFQPTNIRHYCYIRSSSVLSSLLQPFHRDIGAFGTYHPAFLEGINGTADCTFSQCRLKI